LREDDDTMNEEQTNMNGKAAFVARRVLWSIFIQLFQCPGLRLPRERRHDADVQPTASALRAISS